MQMERTFDNCSPAKLARDSESCRFMLALLQPIKVRGHILMESIKEFLSAPWNTGVGAWAAVISAVLAGVLIIITIRSLRPGGGRGGDATLENADGEAYGGKGGAGGGRFGPGGDGGTAKVVGAKGKAIGGDGGDVGSR